MQSAEEEHVTPVDLENEEFMEKIIKEEDEDDFCKLIVQFG